MERYILSIIPQLILLSRTSDNPFSDLHKVSYLLCLDIIIINREGPDENFF